MTHDELVERVARAIMSPKADPSDWRFWTDEARIAISVVLEEAANVAENKANKLSQHRDVYSALQAATAEDIAEEIRTLKT
jgi:hypothetical protein